MYKLSGKIGHHFFDGLIAGRCGYRRDELAQGPQFGLDVAVVDLHNNLSMALTSDPLSLIPSLGMQESAWLSVHLMANDMATTGFAPMYAQFVLNLPPSLGQQDFDSYWSYIHQYCVSMKTSITGGHTGFIEGQNSTIAGGGTFITVAPKNQLLTANMAQTDDEILVTKSCAISSAAILALSFPQTVKNKAGTEIQNLAGESFYHTSSLKDALAAVGDAREYTDVSAMHDVTEGGVLGAIYEMATASNLGALVFDQKLPINQVQEKVCAVFDLNPRFCIGAGAMIIACKKGTSATVVERLAKENIACTKVGEFKPKAFGVKLCKQEQKVDMPYLSTDPYWAAFFNALNSGWK